MTINTSNSPTTVEAPCPATAADYDGTTPFTDDGGPPTTFQGRVGPA